MTARLKCISFLSDFGLKDETVAVCKGRLLSEGISLPVIDISHQIEPFSIISGGWILSGAVSYLPVGIHLAVVDPGVGTSRKVLILQCERGDILLGPDNGILLPSISLLGGLVKAWSLPERLFQQPMVSKTFHARDIMIPTIVDLVKDTVGAGENIPVDPVELVPFPARLSVTEGGISTGTVVHIDHFGTIRTNIPWKEEWKGSAQFSADFWGGRTLPVGQTFADVPSGCPLVIKDSWGFLSIAVNRGKAVDVFPVNIGRTLSVKIMMTESTVKE